MIFNGEHGKSTVLRTFDVPSDRTVPVPDEGCGFIDSKTNNGVDSITLKDVVVNCDVKTEGDVTIQDDTVVIGNIESTKSSVTVDQSETLGSVKADSDVNIPEGEVSGSVTAVSGTVDMGEGNVSGDISAGDDIDLGDNGWVNVGGSVDAEDVDITGADIDGSMTATDTTAKLEEGSVGGDVVAEDERVTLGGLGTVDIGGSVIAKDGEAKVERGTVGGDVVSETNAVTLGGQGPVDVEGSLAGKSELDITDTTVENEAYTDGPFLCASSTIAGQSCGSYSPGSYSSY